MRNYALLVRKDLMTVVSSYGPSSLTFLVWFLICAAIPSFLPLTFNLIVYIFVVALFQSEENDLICNVRAILPVKRSQIVLARYIYLYLLLFVELLYVSIACPLINLLLNKNNQWLFPALVGISISLIMASVMMPLMYKYGVIKMKMISYIVYLVVIAGSSLLMPMIGASTDTGPFLPIALAAFGISVLVSLLSLFISTRIKD